MNQDDMTNKKKEKYDAGDARRVEQLSYLQAVSRKKGSRIMAWLLIVIIVGLVIATFISGVTGSKYFLPFLFLCILIPLLIYLLLWIGNVIFSIGRKNQGDLKDESFDSEDDK